MAARSLVLFLGALLLGCVQAKPSFYEIINRQRAGYSDPAKATSYDYDNHYEQACLRQGQISQCRVMGCLTCGNGSVPWGAGYRSEMTCCDGGRQYRDSVGGVVAMANSKVGSCDWENNYFKENSSPAEGYLLPLVESNIAAKVGSALGNCHLNDHAGDCDDHFCGGMTITMQGGMYLAVAYSEDPGNTIDAPSGDTCEVFELFNNCLTGNSTACSMALLMGQASTNLTANAEASLNVIKSMAMTTPLFRELAKETGIEIDIPGLPFVYRPRDPALGDTPLYAGLSVVYMGQTTVSASRELTVRETRHMEFTAFYIPVTSTATGNHNWPYVQGGKMKLWFQREKGEERY